MPAANKHSAAIMTPTIGGLLSKIIGFSSYAKTRLLCMAFAMPRRASVATTQNDSYPALPFRPSKVFIRSAIAALQSA